MLPRQEPPLENGSRPVDPGSESAETDFVPSVGANSFAGQPAASNGILLVVNRIAESFGRVTHFLGELWRFASAILSAFFPGLQRQRKIKPWMIVRRSKSKPGLRE